MDAFSQLILLIAVVSFFTFQWLFHSVSPWVSSRVSHGFLRLNHKQKIEWNSRTVSTFHALVVGLFCLYILLFDDAVNQDPVWGDPTLVKINVGITTGYLISDLLLIFYYWRAIGDKFFVIHHLAALYACYYVLVSALLSNSGTCRQDGKKTTKGEQHFSWHCRKNSLKWAAEEIRQPTHWQCQLAGVCGTNHMQMYAFSLAAKCRLLFRRLYLSKGWWKIENPNMLPVFVARCKPMRSVIQRYFTK